MKTKNLMIGDWVLFLGHPHQIRAIEHNPDDTFLIIQFYGKNKVITTTEEVEPIPLTTDILEKNGFKFEYDVFGVGNKDAWIWEWINPGDKEYELPNGFYIMSHHDKKRFPHFWINADNNPEIRYVHELQHALWFCKIDKEIILK